jgi:hypothetical protein
MDKFLSKFYAAVRTKQGSEYSENGLKTLRYGLQKHFSAITAVDIINDARFSCPE